MKNIDIKSLIIGALLTSTIILGVGATSKADAGKWDDKQEWEIKTIADEPALVRARRTIGWEPIAVQGVGVSFNIIYRKRIK